MDAKTRRVTAHLTPATIETAGTAESLSAGLNRIADRYRAMVASVGIDARFSAEEWGLIREAMKAWPAESAMSIRRRSVAAVAKSMEGSHDGNIDLFSRLCALAYVEEVALVDAVERYWKGSRDGMGSESKHG